MSENDCKDLKKAVASDTKESVDPFRSRPRISRSPSKHTGTHIANITTPTSPLKSTQVENKAQINKPACSTAFDSTNTKSREDNKQKDTETKFKEQQDLDPLNYFSRTVGAGQLLIEIGKNKRLSDQFSSPSLSPNSTNLTFKATYDLNKNNETIKRRVVSLPITTSTENLIDKSLSPNKSSEFESSAYNWSFHTDSFRPMARMTIKEVTNLIRDYDGSNEKELNIFIKNIDRLWQYIAEYTEEEKEIFMMTLNSKITGKAAGDLANITFNNWPTVRNALKEKVAPQQSVEKSELKLTTVIQGPEESVEAYAKRVEELLSDLNTSYGLEGNNEILKVENDRKARRSFENGLYDGELRNKAISRGTGTLRSAIDYVCEQELRNPPFRRRSENPTVKTEVNTFRRRSEPLKICTFCNLRGHEVRECRRRMPSDGYSPGVQSRQTREVICFRCHGKGHYASSCSAPKQSGNANNADQRPPNNFRNPPRNNPNEAIPNRNVRMIERDTYTISELYEMLEKEKGRKN